MGPRNRFQGMNSASLCSLAGRYDNPIPLRFLAPIECLKIPAQHYCSIPGGGCYLIRFSKLTSTAKTAAMASFFYSCRSDGYSGSAAGPATRRAPALSAARPAAQRGRPAAADRPAGRRGESPAAACPQPPRGSGADSASAPSHPAPATTSAAASPSGNK